MRPTSSSNRRSSRYIDTSFSPPKTTETNSNPAPPGNPEIGDSAGIAAYGLDLLLANRVRLLAELVYDVKEQIADRKALSEKLLTDLEAHDLFARDQLNSLRFWPLALNDAIDGRRRSLEQQLDMLRHEKRQEQARAWSDTALLHRELRDRLREYVELQNRTALLGAAARPDNRGTRPMNKEQEGSLNDKSSQQP